MSRGLSIWIGAARPKTLPAAIVPVLTGSAVAAADGGFTTYAAGLCLAFAILIQIGTNFANDYFDAAKGADTPDRIGPTRAVAAGLVPPRRMLLATLAVMLAAFLTGLGLVAYGGLWLIPLGALCIICGFAYTGGPYPLAYNGLGDLFVFIFFGLVATGFTHFVQTWFLSADAFIYGAAVGLLSTNILVVNNIRDIPTDRKAGKRTLAVLLGHRFSILQYKAQALIALLCPVYVFAAGNIPQSWWLLLPLALWPLSWRLSQQVALAEDRATYARCLAGTAAFLVAFGILASLGLILAGV